MSEPRVFYIWPKRQGEFFGQILSESDFESAINPHCLANSFKVIEYSAFEKSQKDWEQAATQNYADKCEIEKLQAQVDVMREALEFYAAGCLMDEELADADDRTR